MQKNKKKTGLTLFYTVIAIFAVLIATSYQAIQTHLNLGLDLVGGFEILYEVTPLTEGKNVDMAAVTNSIQKRINVLGVNEPLIMVEGNNRVRVQLAGVADQQSAREMLGTTANLTFNDVDDNELADSSIIEEGGASLAYQDGRPIVSLKIKDKAKFGEMTGEISQKPAGENIMIIWLDHEDGDSYKDEFQKSLDGQEPKYISAASVRTRIDGDCVIEGSFTEKEAKTLAELINSGSLPVKMTEISSNVVSAQYGQDALNKTAFAGLLGVIAIMIFMIYTYRLPGVIASIMLCVYVWAIFGLYALMGAVFTLPGIGALVLGVGMTVDANIITYERIRQELWKGRRVVNAANEGQKLSFSSIFDAQITTLIAGLIMYWWGNGAVKGFATMLIITVFMTLVLNVAISRWLLNMVVSSGKTDDKPQLYGVKADQIPDVSKGQTQFYTGVKPYDFVKNAKKYIRVSVAIIAVALVFSIVNASKGQGMMNKGIDFAAGTKLTISSNEAISIEDVKNELNSLGYEGFKYQVAGEDTVYATTKQALDKEDLNTIKDAFIEKYGIEPGDNVVTPIVGRELAHNAMILTLVAWVAMLAYIAMRYEWDYAVSCLVALVHDVLITLSVFAILRLEVNTELISVLLTIIGYSINNSIVVFDRLREIMNDKHNHVKKSEYAAIVNESLGNTIRMSLNSSFSTLLPVIFLLALGSKSIFTFTFAMFVGMIAGTISSIFIAPRMWLYIRSHHDVKKKPKKEVYKESLDEYTIKGINA